MEDVMKKFGATPYVPGEEIILVIPESKIPILDKIVRGKFKKESKPA